MSAVIGEAILKLKFDGKGVDSEISNTAKKMENAGSNSGSKFGTAWSVAVGSLMSKGISKAMQMVSSKIDSAIKRVDTLNNFPKVMSNLGISATEAEQSISKMSEKLQGLPTTLDQGASAVQRFASKNNDVKKSTDMFLALNNALLAGGQSTDIQATALEQLSQAYAKGKPDMVEWRSLMTAMPAQLNQVAQQMGYGKNGMDKLGEAIRNGDVSMDQFMDTIIKMNTEGAKGFQNFEEQAKNSTGGIQTAMAVMESRITQGIASVIQEIGSENIASIATGIGDAIKKVGTTIANVVKFIIDNWQTIGPILGVLGTVAGTIIAINTAITAWQAVTQAFTAVQAVFNAVMNANPIFLLVTVLSAVVAGLTYFFTQTEAGKAIIQGFGEVISNVFGAIGEFIGNVWNGITEGAKAVWDFITGLFSGLANFFGNIFSNAWNAVKNVFSTGGQIFMGIVDGITNAFRTIVNAIITGINHVVALPFNAINGFLSFLKSIDILGIKPFDWVGTIDVPQIPLLAEGGVATGATNAIIGEAGEEVVLPLENNTDNWAGLLASTLVAEMEFDSMAGREINVYMTNNINSRLDAQEMGRVMVQSIRRAV